MLSEAEKDEMDLTGKYMYEIIDYCNQHKHCSECMFLLPSGDCDVGPLSLLSLKDLSRFAAKIRGSNLNGELAPVPDQTAKADAGKPDLTLVPWQIVWDIAEVRMYGVQKYVDPDNWKRVGIQRYKAALMRHWLKYLDDPDSVDEESGIEHWKHAACNMAFICAMEEKRRQSEQRTN